MHSFATALRRVAEALDVTEAEAFTSYSRHVRGCATCGPRKRADESCQLGMRMWTIWRQSTVTDANQVAQAAAGRRGGRAR
jgi:hypothetical protein